MADTPLTTQELYGKSDPPSPPATKPPEPPLVYEETPILEPVSSVATAPHIYQQPKSSAPNVTQASRQTYPPRPKPPSGVLKHLGTLIFFIVLFGVGVWLSTLLKQYTAPTVEIQQNTLNTPTPVDALLPLASPSGQQVVSPQGWKLYTIAGATYQLPSDLLPPICDGAACVSQGTYLPGGSRFTVATNTNGALLSNARGAAIVDSGGREFTTTQTTIAGKQAYEFSGQFLGTTTGGYSFSQMRGVMIIVDGNLVIELNHFTPTGVTADFVSDDQVFDQILQTLSFQ